MFVTCPFHGRTARSSSRSKRRCRDSEPAGAQALQQKSKNQSEERETGRVKEAVRRRDFRNKSADLQVLRGIDISLAKQRRTFSDVQIDGLAATWLPSAGCIPQAKR